MDCRRCRHESFPTPLRLPLNSLHLSAFEDFFSNKSNRYLYVYWSIYKWTNVLLQDPGDFSYLFFLLCVVRAARGSAPPMTKGIVALEEAEKPSFPQKQHPTIIGFFHSFCDKPLTDSLSFSLPFTPLFSSVQFLLHCRHNRRRQCGGDYSATDLRSVPASACFFAQN